jgi:lysophospholipase L1-like esterase
MVDYPWTDIHARVAAAARRNGLVVVDLLSRYREAGFASVRADGVHPNAAGHRLAAEAIDATLKRRGLLAGS